MVRVTKGHEHDKHEHHKRTISELIAAGQGNAIVPGDIMEQLYDIERQKSQRKKLEERRDAIQRKIRKRRERLIDMYQRVTANLIENFLKIEKQIAQVILIYKVLMMKMHWLRCTGRKVNT